MSVWSSVLPSPTRRFSRAACCACDRSSWSMSALRRVQLGGETVLDERFVELAQGRQAPALDEVILRGAQPGPFETETRVGVVRRLAQRLRCIRRPPGRSPDAARRRGPRRNARRRGTGADERRTAAPRRRARERLCEAGGVQGRDGFADNIDTARDLESELLIGQTDVFLQVREGEGRRPTLRVDRHQSPDDERRRIDRQDEPIVFRLPRFRYELQRQAAGRQPGGQLDEGRREIASSGALFPPGTGPASSPRHRRGTGLTMTCLSAGM